MTLSVLSSGFFLIGAGLVGLVIAFGALTWTGVQAALDARQAYRELEGELAHFTPVDLLQVNIYDSLEDRFREAEEALARARSRLAFLGAFQWVPVVGGEHQGGQAASGYGVPPGEGREVAGDGVTGCNIFPFSSSSCSWRNATTGDENRDGRAGRPEVAQPWCYEPA